MTAPTVAVSLRPPPRRRGVELALLVFAVLVAVLGLASVGEGTGQGIPSDVVTYGTVLAVLFLVVHLAVRFFAPYADPLLVPIPAALNGIGLFVIHRIDVEAQVSARAAHLPVPSSDAHLQLVWTAIGVGLFVAVLAVIRDHRVLQRYTYTALVVGLLLLLIPAVLPASHSEVNGARIWIRLGGLSFEPEELAKLVLIVFFAGYFVSKRELLSLAGRRVLGVDLPRARDMAPVLLAWGATVLVLMRESDIGTALLFFAIFVAMLYVATARYSWLLIGLLLFAIAAFAAVHFVPHVRERVDVWLNPFAHESTTGYQLSQGLFGLAEGGVFGTGLGLGRPNMIPFANTDMIAASIGEELGLAGLMAILILFVLLVSRAIRAGLATRDSFGKLFAAGLACAIAFQVFVQVGGATRLIPLTGITLPFVSYGGSSLVSSWMLIALLVRISHDGRQPAPVGRPAGPPVTDAPTVVVRS
jgi:cell division protein FtsW (lipid II flippase)